jgi:hypothetical protein
MNQAGSKIRKWDEINGREEEISEPDVTPKDRMNGPEVGPCGNYLKTAEEQMEDDYDSIDGIVNNGKRENTDGLAEAERMSVKEKLREQEEKLRTRPVNPPHREKDPLCPDRNLC